jgi:hypothetical protein
VFPVGAIIIGEDSFVVTSRQFGIEKTMYKTLGFS